MAYASTCDKCMKSDVCNQKDFVQAAEHKLRQVAGQGVIKDSVLTWDNPKLSESYDLKNKGIIFKVECSKRASGYEN